MRASPCTCCCTPAAAQQGAPYPRAVCGARAACPLSAALIMLLIQSQHAWRLIGHHAIPANVSTTPFTYAGSLGLAGDTPRRRVVPQPEIRHPQGPWWSVINVVLLTMRLQAQPWLPGHLFSPSMAKAAGLVTMPTVPQITHTPTVVSEEVSAVRIVHGANAHPLVRHGALFFDCPDEQLRQHCLTRIPGETVPPF